MIDAMQASLYRPHAASVRTDVPPTWTPWSRCGADGDEAEKLGKG